MSSPQQMSLATLLSIREEIDREIYKLTQEMDDAKRNNKIESPQIQHGNKEIGGKNKEKNDSKMIYLLPTPIPTDDDLFLERYNRLIKKK